MKSTSMLMTCRVLIVALLTLSFSTARAGMIGAEQAAPQVDRGAIVALMDRAEVAAQLQAYGVDPAAAKARVATMNEQELSQLSAAIEAAPAGAMSGWAWAGVVVLVAAIVWYFVMRK